MPVRGRLPLLALLLLSVGCGSPGGGGPDAPRSGGSFEARFILAQPLSRGHFDASSPRARKVDGQLTEMLGHPLVFYFDAALVPKWEDDFESLSIAALEDVAQRLAVLKRSEPAMFAWGAPRLKRLEWDYDATKEYEEETFDASSGKLRVQLTPKSSALIAEHELEYAIGRGWSKELASRFAEADPASVSRADDDRYFEWLSDFAYGYEKDRAPPKGAEEKLDTPSALQLLRMLRYAEVLRGKSAPVEARVRDWLVEKVRYLEQTPGESADEVAAAPASHPFHQAERAWTVWLVRAIDGLSDAQQRSVVEEIREARERKNGGAATFPGFDEVGYALRVAERWRSAGHPSTRDDDDEKNRDRDRLFDEVIAPLDFPPDERTGCRETSALLYKRAAADPKARARLFDDAFGKKDVAWEKLVLANLLGTESEDAVFAFWKRSEADEGTFHAATRVLAGHIEGCSFAQGSAFDRLPALWHARPRSHGVLLFMLARYGGEQVGWEHFEHLFEAKLSKGDVAAYLDEEVDPFRHLHWMWPAFAAGWSHAEAVVPRLDGWLTDDYRKFNMWGQELISLAEDFCADKSPADSARYHVWLEARAKVHPSEERTMEQALEKSKPGGCR